MDKFWVYVLQSEKHNRQYVGSTQDIDVRLKRHNKGDCNYTKKFRPWKVIHQESFNSRSEAIQQERFYKSGQGREILKERLEKICPVV